MEATVQTIREAVEQAGVRDYQVVLVDDGSTDNTGKIMDRLASPDGQITAVHNERNLGPGGAYKRGAAAARCEYLMVIAGDNAAPAESIRATIAHLGEADIIISYPANPEIRSLRRRLGSQAFTTVINVLSGFHMPYYNGAVLRRRLLEEIHITSNGYAFFAEMVVKLMKAGSSHVKVGVYHTASANACSSALKLKNLLKVFKDVVHLAFEMRRPDNSALLPLSNRSPDKKSS